MNTKKVLPISIIILLVFVIGMSVGTLMNSEPTLPVTTEQQEVQPDLIKHAHVFIAWYDPLSTEPCNHREHAASWSGSPVIRPDCLPRGLVRLAGYTPGTGVFEKFSVKQICSVGGSECIHSFAGNQEEPLPIDGDGKDPETLCKFFNHQWLTQKAFRDLQKERTVEVTGAFYRDHENDSGAFKRLCVGMDTHHCKHVDGETGSMLWDYSSCPSDWYCPAIESQTIESYCGFKEVSE